MLKIFLCFRQWIGKSPAHALKTNSSDPVYSYHWLYTTKALVRPLFIYTMLSVRIHQPWRVLTSATTLFFCLVSFKHVGPGMINRYCESIQMLILSDWNIPHRAVKNRETTLAASYWQPLSWALINMVMMCEGSLTSCHRSSHRYSIKRA